MRQRGMEAIRFSKECAPGIHARAANALAKQRAPHQ